jgi:hypothetical protein
MAAPGVPIKFVYRFDEAGPQRIEMNISNQFEKVVFLVANNRLVPVLEKMAGAMVPEVEGHCVPGQKSPHEISQGGLARAQEKVDMIVEQRPGETVSFGGDKIIRESSHKLTTIIIVGEDVTPLDTADDNVL